MNKCLCLLLLLCIFMPLMGLANPPAHLLIENKGQWPAAVQGKFEIPGGDMFVEDQGFTYNLRDLSEIRDLHENANSEGITPTVYGHAFQMRFEQSNPDAEIEFEHEQPTYFNYFLGNDPSKWAGGAKSYSGAWRREIYPLTDLHIYSTEAVIKYDLHIQPGGDPELITWNYDGVDKVKLDNGRLVIKTSVGEIWEQKPIAFQYIFGEKILVPCNYVLDGITVSFELPNGYDPRFELIIDPELIFSTYSGSTADNFGYTATFDDEGYLYSGSSAFGDGYPVTLGAYQTDWAGGDGQGFLVGTDIAITKYDVTGTFRVYSTYLGGPNDELPHSLIVNNAGELIVMGTSSSPQFPTTPNAYSDTYEGGSTVAPQGVGVSYVNGSDIVVTKFNALGTDIVASTFLGGSGNDGVNTATALKFNYADEFRGEVELDNEGNIYIASCTYSSDFPVVNAPQPVIGGGLDGCVTKFDPDLGDILWSTYHGGSGDDGCYALAVTTANDVVVCGGTTSTDLSTTPGVFQGNNAGGSADGFVVRYPEDGGNVEVAGYYGSSAYDQAYFVELDDQNRIHIYGQTMAADNTMIQNAIYGTPNSGMLVSKFDQDMSTLEWSTVFGTGSGEPNLSPTAFLVDVCGKIYLSGWGGTTNTSSNPNTDLVWDMEVTADAYQSETNGSDFYLIVLEDDASDLVYASFFGGLTSNEHVDGGTSRFNRKGQIYQSVCAGCGGNSDFPIFPANAVSPTNNSTNCNNGVFKFDFQLPITVADFFVPPLGCVNTPITFNNLSTVSLNFFWDFGDDQTSTDFNPTHTYTEPGEYTIMLVASHPNTCNMTDTLYRTIDIQVPNSGTLDNLQLCEGESGQLGPVDYDPTHTYEWFPADNLSSSELPEPITYTTEDESYTLLIDNGACIDTLYQDVEVTVLDLYVPSDTTLCDENEVLTLLATTSLEDAEFLWSSDPDFTDQLNDGPDDPDIEVNVSEATTFYVQLTSGECTRTEEVNVDFIGAQTAIGGDLVACAGDTLNLNVLNPSDDLDYFWLPEEYIISGQNTPNVTVAVPGTTVITVESTNEDGCTAEDSAIISISGLSSDQVNATADPEVISTGDNSQLQAQPDGYDYEWFPTSSLNNSTISNPVATPDQDTWYLLTVFDGECIHYDSVLVRVFDFICGPPAIYVPNAFTPNSDDQNELLYVYGNFITDMKLSIYDRWGEKVFETTSQNQGWDGTFKGKPVDPDVFVYHLEAVCEGGETYFEKGNITVFR